MIFFQEKQSIFWKHWWSTSFSFTLAFFLSFPLFGMGVGNHDKKEKSKDQSSGHTMGFEIRALHWGHGPPHPLTLLPIFLYLKCSCRPYLIRLLSGLSDKMVWMKK